MRLRRAVVSWRFWTLLGLLVACGSRTGLGIDEITVPPDASVDAPVDVTLPRDSGRDVAREADALPPLDASKRDADKTNCPDADSTLVYLVSDNNVLQSFYPPTATFTNIGTLVCPNAGGGNPFSMAVDRKGVAYVLFNNGRLFRVSTATAACVATTYQPGQLGFTQFGMGFVADQGGPTETLYVAGTGTSPVPDALGRIDVTNFQLTSIANFSPPITGAELTGTGDGRLYAFHNRAALPGTSISEIDPTTAQVIGQSNLPTVDRGNGWAFAFWGGDFYLFVGATPSASRVVRFRPADNSVATVAQATSLIVGAGVSTCAPQ